MDKDFEEFCYLTSFDETKICYQKHLNNNQSTLILLHGLGGDLTAWNEEIEYLKDNYNIIAVDLRGHGESDRLTDLQGYSLDNFAKDIYTLIQTENIQNPILVGHCFGGMISMLVCLKYPSLLEKLILIDTSYKPPHIAESFKSHPFIVHIIDMIVTEIPDIGLKYRKDYHKYKDTPDFQLKRIVSDILHTSLRSYLLLAEELIDYNIEDLLAEITIPTLIIEGEKDSVFPPNIAEDLYEHIKNSKLNIIPAGNHILPLNNPKDIFEKITLFV